MNYRVSMLAGGLLLAVANATAAPIDFSDYRLLERGMSEAEVLMRVGEPDRKFATEGGQVGSTAWHYLPGDGDSWQFITIITIGSDGRVTGLERQNP